MNSNPQLELAYNFVEFTDRNIFLTGKAGTGKTTFLRNLQKTSSKRLAIVAPTGVAAINAGGVTINSFFQLPFGPYVPGQKESDAQVKKFSRDKINLIRSLDLLVIDEISMVRADMLDQIDNVLRKYRDRSRPFGGVQLLMIGDLHQLSPVVKDEDWAILRGFYSNLFFFSSQALSQTSPITIELKHIYRQADESFITLLNQVRKNEIDQDVLKALNSRYQPDFTPSEDDGYITLTTHNKSAQEINDQRLSALDSPLNVFRAEVQNEFPEFSFPTVGELELKEGAQVMFVKNDPSRDRLYYNGKIGTVTRFEDEHIYVRCAGENSEIAVGKVEWTNIRYTLDSDTKEVQEKVIGTFTQYPLKLAWAITIHKSQGLTFDRAIIDAGLAFAHGQVYVALSRCKTFEGLILRSRIESSSVRTDTSVAEYSKTASDNEPDENELYKSRIGFQQNLIYELFDFSQFKVSLYRLNKVYEDHHHTLNDSFGAAVKALRTNFDNEIGNISEAFRRQLSGLFDPGVMPEEDSKVQERLKKGSVYFREKLRELSAAVRDLDKDTDNQAVAAEIESYTDELNQMITVKSAVLDLAAQQFSTKSYLRTKADTQIDHENSKTSETERKFRIPTTIPHPELYATIRSWRSELAAERAVPAYHILSQKSLSELLVKLPVSIKELEKIKGIGKVKIRQFGADLLGMIGSYCQDKGIPQNETGISDEAKPEKIKTGQITFDLFRSGKAISEIAAERGVTTSTVETHLIQYIASGDLPVFEIVPKLKVAKITAAIAENPGSSVSDIKSKVGESISYNEIRAVMAHLALMNQ